VNHLPGRKLLHSYLEGEFEAAQQSRIDAHLADCADCAREVRELRETVSLLHSLPDEEAPPRLADDVMDRIAAGEGQPSRLVVAFRSIAGPSAGLALAAGVAGVLVLSTVEFSSPGPPGETLRSTPAAVADAAVPGGGGLGRLPMERREVPVRAPAAPSRIAPRTVTGPPVILDVSSAAAGRSAYFRVDGPQLPHEMAPNTLLLDLVDEELDRLLRDPDAFVALMRDISDGERTRSIARLAARAAARGDQAEVIRRLRAVEHPFGPRLAARFERRAQVTAGESAARSQP
jgi:hypothetical protein